MRALFIADNAPWPPAGGGLLRLAQTIETLAHETDLELFVNAGHDRFVEISVERSPNTSARRCLDVEPPEHLQLVRWRAVPYPRHPSQLAWRLRWLFSRNVPMEVVMSRADQDPARALASWADPPYDLVWFSTSRTFDWLGRPRLGPTVVDLVDLEDQKALSRVQVLESQIHRRAKSQSHLATNPPPSPQRHRRWASSLDHLRARGALWQATRNALAWKAFQAQLASEVDAVVVASELDLKRCGLPNASVVPNTYPCAGEPAGDPLRGGTPTILFQGSLTYPPNADAAWWLASEIAPLLREHIADAGIRLVGQPSTGVRELDDPPQVKVVGRVPSMESELASATVVAVPIRYGSGTRLKILEAFAHRVPVVSTTLGAEGLGAVDGVHLLIADDATSFAHALAQLLSDEELRVRLTNNARLLWQERYNGAAAREAVRDILRAFRTQDS